MKRLEMPDQEDDPGFDGWSDPMDEDDEDDG